MSDPESTETVLRQSASHDPILTELLARLTFEFDRHVLVCYLESPSQETIERVLDSRRKPASEEGVPNDL